MRIKNKFKVCILGSGFGGITTLTHLKRLMGKNKDVEITLISESKNFVFMPLLHEVATGEVREEHINYPVIKLKNELGNFNFINEIVNDIDFNKKIVKTSTKEIDYNYLVISLGSISNFYENKEIEKNVYKLKTPTDATRIKNHIIGCLEKADMSEDIEERKRLTNFIVVGGGATGVELAGGMVYFIKEKVVKLKNVSMIDINIFLIEKIGKLLQEMDSDKCSNIALERFNSLGVKVLLNSEITEYDKVTAKLKSKNADNPDEIKTETVIWAAGVKPVELIEKLNIKKDKSGKIIIDDYLSTPDYPEVFAIGDNAVIEGKKIWTTAQNAVQQAETVAHNIYAKTQLFRYSKKFKYFHQGTLVTIGKNFAVNDLFGLKVTGFKGWFVWKLIHVVKMTGSVNKVNVFFDWLRTLYFKRYDQT